MKIIGIIPSRYASTRFPGKPLVDIGGKTMIQRVYEQALKAQSLSEVIVATDDERIYNEVKNFGGNVVMTSDTHKNGTERCAEVASGSNADVVINIQGDEPFIEPVQIDLLAGSFENKEVQIATLVREFLNEKEKHNPSRVKAFVNQAMLGISFSRLPQGNALVNEDYRLFKHIGIYAFRTNILRQIVQLPSSNLEMAESLEQLRWLQNGYRIYCALTEHESISIDTPEDWEAVKDRTA